MNKYIFIDIDGVLNPHQPRPGGFRHHVWPYGPFKPGWYLNLHPEYGQWLMQLADATGAELAWGSAWQRHANRWAGRPLGLPRLRYLKLPRKKRGVTLGWRKAQAVSELPEDARFVYFDDEPDLGSYLADGRGRHIWVDPDHGLAFRHILEAAEFLSSGEEGIPQPV